MSPRHSYFKRLSANRNLITDHQTLRRLPQRETREVSDWTITSRTDGFRCWTRNLCQSDEKSPTNQRSNFKQIALSRIIRALFTHSCTPKLFKKLEDVLCPHEIALLKARDSKNQIKLGKQSFAPNIGVAQGSLVSPSFSNIGCSGLSHTLTNEIGISIDNIMGYTDDIFILCTSPFQLRKFILTVK